ncbi:hypothetical protein ATE84_3825 [Aquimarina sp. MAR_2010_214]|uniref:hypothetical protein n=1 Tax=Aquimarina sp. MAR_2010_214 TaxID=1250026 RepID=UPI000C7149BC|nr:hypothetical protein [Aquimarina sp. MAR_2010_214]PKV51727.1 hypothetical protein ATE84_3825 [Aquimarina sp. MAR_2010_214]
MKTNTKPTVAPDRFKVYEETVFNYLSIAPQLFNTCVKEHRGYAFLLRVWIEEKYTNGCTALEVSEMIKRSKLRIEAIKMGKPLYIAV